MTPIARQNARSRGYGTDRLARRERLGWDEPDEVVAVVHQRELGARLLDISVEEGGFEPAVLADLQRRGHRTVTIDDYNQFGSAQLIWKLDGGYFAASDPRRDGQAVGF